VNHAVNPGNKKLQNVKKTTPLIFLVAATIIVQAALSDEETGNMVMRYREPAKKWTDALPVGNGRLGAMVFGRVAAEHLQLNADTLWSGAPKDRNNPGARDALPEVRKLVFRKRYIEADQAAKKMMGPFTQPYQPMGDLHLEFDNGERPDRYIRTLDIDSAVAETKYEIDGITYVRKVFASKPDDVVVVRLEANRPGKISITASLTSKLMFRTRAEGEDLVLEGKAPLHNEPHDHNDRGVVYADGWTGEGMNFEVRIRVLPEGGRVVTGDRELSVERADAATLIISAATSFNGFDKSPGLEGVDPLPIAKDRLEAAAGIDYDKLLERHIADYRELFRRVHIDLGKPLDKALNISTDSRVNRYGGSDPGLVELLFQYGRYLMISGSRPGTQPLNLQGIWNDHVQPPWNSNYTININTEMNYWPAEVTNLAECHEPLLDMIGELAVNGAETARINYGARGWVAHHNTDLWRQTAPVGAYGAGDPVWAMWEMGGAWLSRHLWEHYAFGRDEEYLRGKAFPVMKGAAEFMLDWLVMYKDGTLVTNPCTSPEHKFLTKYGVPAATSAGCTTDIAIIRDLFTNCIEASGILGIDEDFRKKLETALEKLHRPGIGGDGRLQEWMFDFPDSEPHHRHFSHLFGVHPGRWITRENEPELFEAARRSMEIRGDGGTGWSLGWKINFWARMGDGEHAFKLIDNVLKLSENDYVDFGQRGGVYTNLFGAHPPFQIDGNFSFTSGIAEMLLQSHEGDVHLLPALPGAWPGGSVTGLRARGGFEVDIHWKEGKLDKAVIKSEKGLPCRARYGGKTVSFDTEKDGVYILNNTLKIM